MKNPTVEVVSEPCASGLPEFWEPHYEAVFAQCNPWLDLSNHRVHLQGLAAALDASGGVLGHTCLDAGCGMGHLPLALKAFGAASVTAVDFNGVMLDELRRKH